MNVVFDFGAVLFTWRPAELLAQCFPELSATPQQAGHLAHAVFGHPDWHDFDRGTLSMAAVVDRTAERLGLNHGVLHKLVEGIGEKLVPMAESVALLTQLHAQRTVTASESEPVPASSPAVRLYYLSNMPQPYARALERLHPFLQWFDGGIFSGDVYHIKPEPAIYALLQTRYALKPTQTVFIDDLLGNVQAARTLGWHGIHFESAAQVAAQLQTLNLGK